MNINPLRLCHLELIFCYLLSNNIVLISDNSQMRKNYFLIQDVSPLSHNMRKKVLNTYNMELNDLRKLLFEKNFSFC